MENEYGHLTRRQFMYRGFGVLALGLLEPARTLAALRPTEPSILGPYYRRGAPLRASLAGAEEPGTPLLIKGRVLDVAGKPLAGALVDVWQANATGEYDNSDPVHPPRANEFRFRARMHADAHGAYAFDTILPGRYLNGPRYRPRHIHYVITHTGCDPLTTQLYFRGDPYIQGDAFVHDSLVIGLKRRAPSAHEPRKYLSGVFDIVLARPGQIGVLLPTPPSA